MTIGEVMNAVATLGGERDVKIQQLTEQLAERYAKIRELEDEQDAKERHIDSLNEELARLEGLAYIREPGSNDGPPILWRDIARKEKERGDNMAAEAESLEQQVAEKDAKIQELETRDDSYEAYWQELRDATGCETHFDALDWIKAHRAADQQQPAPEPEPEWELVPWTAETRPRGVVMFRVVGFPDAQEMVLDRWKKNGIETKKASIDWQELWHEWEWSRDGITWDRCGVIKAVQA